MDDYISREAVLSHSEIIQVYSKDYGNIDVVPVEYLADIPTADVQPVVRCKDCKHRKERHYEESGEEPYIKYECKFTKYSMSDEGFCSFGAKRDGDSE